jgi:hypothetical protein
MFTSKCIVSQSFVKIVCILKLGSLPQQVSISFAFLELRETGSLVAAPNKPDSFNWSSYIRKECTYSKMN